MRKRGAYLGMGVILGLWIIFTLIPYAEGNPVQYTNQPFPIDGPVRIGEPIPMHVKRCSSAADVIDIEFARSLVRVDGESRAYSLGDGRSVVLPGCLESVSGTTVVPPSVPPGTYQLVGVATITGRFQTHKVAYRSETFQVIP